MPYAALGTWVSSAAAEIAAALDLLDADEVARIFADRHVNTSVLSRRGTIAPGALVATELSSAPSVKQALSELSLRELAILRVLWRSGPVVRTGTIGPAFSTLLDSKAVDQALAHLQDLALVVPADASRESLGVPSCVRAALLGRPGPARPATDVFERHTSETLAAICTGLGIKLKSNRKDDRLAAIIAELTSSDNVRRRVADLPELERRIFEDVVQRGGDAEPWPLLQKYPEVMPEASGRGYYGGSSLFMGGYGWKYKELGPLQHLQAQGLLVAYPADWPAQLVVCDEVLNAALPPLRVNPADFVEPGFVAPTAEARPAGAQLGIVLDLVECLEYVDEMRPSLTQKGFFAKPDGKRLARRLSVQEPSYGDFVFALAKQLGWLDTNYGKQLRTKPVKTNRWLQQDELTQRADLLAAWQDLIVWRDDNEEGYLRNGETDGGASRQYRALTLRLLRDVPDAGVTIGSLGGRLRYHIPNRFAPETAGEATERLPTPSGFVLGQARSLSWLGLVELLTPSARPGGAAEPSGLNLTAPGRALLCDDEAARSGAAIPRVDRLIVQPTLEVLAPPNVEPLLYRGLRRFTDPGHAGSMRTLTLSGGSLRRAFDGGMKPVAARAFLAEHHGAPLPSTVESLFADVQEKYGRIHVGMASFYLTVDDPHLLAEIEADKRLPLTVVRRLSPTIAIIRGDSLDDILKRLRAAGHMPTPDDHPIPVSQGPDDEPDEETNEIDAIPDGSRILPFRGKAGRAADADVWSEGAETVPEPQTIMELLHEAERRGLPVEIEYESRYQGRPQQTTRVIEVREIEGDSVLAYCRLRQDEREFSLARIKSARLAVEEDI